MSIEEHGSKLKTREDKKREILKRIEKIAKNGDIVSLTRGSLLDDFTDSYYTQVEIEAILDDLIENAPVEEAEAELNLVYPSAYKDALLDDFKENRSMSFKGMFLLGGYSLFALVVLTDFTNQLSGGMTDGEIIGVSVFGIVFSYLVGKFEVKLMTIAEDKLPIIHKHKNFVYPTTFILLTGFAIAWVASAIYSSQIPVTALASIPASSVLGGAAVARYLDGKKSTEDPIET